MKYFNYLRLFTSLTLLFAFATEAFAARVVPVTLRYVPGYQGADIYGIRPPQSREELEILRFFIHKPFLKQADDGSFSLIKTTFSHHGAVADRILNEFTVPGTARETQPAMQVALEEILSWSMMPSDWRLELHDKKHTVGVREWVVYLNPLAPDPYVSVHPIFFDSALGFLELPPDFKLSAEDFQNNRVSLTTHDIDMSSPFFERKLLPVSEMAEVEIPNTVDIVPPRPSAPRKLDPMVAERPEVIHDVILVSKERGELVAHFGKVYPQETNPEPGRARTQIVTFRSVEGYEAEIFWSLTQGELMEQHRHSESQQLLLNAEGQRVDRRLVVINTSKGAEYAQAGFLVHNLEQNTIHLSNSLTFEPSKDNDPAYIRGWVPHPTISNDFDAFHVTVVPHIENNYEIVKPRLNTRRISIPVEERSSTLYNAFEILALSPRGVKLIHFLHESQDAQKPVRIFTFERGPMDMGIETLETDAYRFIFIDTRMDTGAVALKLASALALYEELDYQSEWIRLLDHHFQEELAAQAIESDALDDAEWERRSEHLEQVQGFLNQKGQAASRSAQAQVARELSRIDPALKEYFHEAGFPVSQLTAQIVGLNPTTKDFHQGEAFIGKVNCRAVLELISPYDGSL